MIMQEQQGVNIQFRHVRESSLVFFVQWLQENTAWLRLSDRSLQLSVLALMSALLVCGGAGCSATARRPLPPPEPNLPSISSTPSSTSPSQIAVASWYGPGFEGRKTASGERFDSQEMTAAHRSLPLGSHVTVTNLDNGKSVRVRINDRGPYIRGRSIDLSRGAARRIGLEKRGVGRVRITADSRRGTGARSTGRRASPARVAQRRPTQTPAASTQPTLGSILGNLWPF
jgi:3D (Asp-Asp-Asp) domain-containing protein